MVYAMTINVCVKGKDNYDKGIIETLSYLVSNINTTCIYRRITNIVSRVAYVKCNMRRSFIARLRNATRIRM